MTVALVLVSLLVGLMLGGVGQAIVRWFRRWHRNKILTRHNLAVAALMDDLYKLGTINEVARVFIDGPHAGDTIEHVMREKGWEWPPTPRISRC